MSIGIVGAGTAGLHLALLLQQRGVDTTLYPERPGDEVAAGRLPNTVAHHNHTRARERELGVNHWDATGPSYDRHYHYFHVDPPLAFPGDFAAPSLAVDYRIYLPRLLEDYESRGGRVVVGPVAPEQLDGLAARHDLVVVATGRGGLAELFPDVPERSPFEGPARLLSAGLYAGIAYTADPLGVTFAVSPGHAEIIEIPLETFEGNMTTLLFETIPGGDLEALARMPYADDPKGYERLVLEKLQAHFPPIFERVDQGEFGLTRPSSILQGAVTPTVREPFTALDGGCAIALGDAHVVVDPVVGQGANAASYAAWVLGEAIFEGGPYDAAFCRRVDERRRDVVLGVFDWTNFMLAPPPYLFELVGAMSQNRALCDDFTQNFNHPDRQWEHLRTHEAVTAYIASFA